MLKNISTLKLVGFLAVLIVIYLAFVYFDDNGRSRSFRKELVRIEPENVSIVSFLKPDGETRLKKDGGQWTVTLPSGENVPAMEGKVNSTLKALQTISPSRIVTRNPDKWAEYNVDTAGTRVRVYEEDQQILDLVIGRFGMKNQREMFTYVRLQDDDEVYVSDDFMSFSVSSDPNSYRNQEVVRLETDSLAAVRFAYPDSAFVLERASQNSWAIGGEPTDSAAVADFVQRLRNLTSNKFMDDVEVNNLEKRFDITFNIRGSDDVFVDVYDHPEKGSVFRSSVNPDALFGDPNLEERLLQRRSSFLKN